MRRRQRRIGCGHKAVALALGVSAEAVRAKADRIFVDGGADRGIGLYTHEVHDLTRSLGGTLEEIPVTRDLVRARAFGFDEGFKRQGPTVAALVRELKAKHLERNTGTTAHYLIHVLRHFVGVVIGATGAVAYTGAKVGWSTRARVIRAWHVRKDT